MNQQFKKNIPKLNLKGVRPDSKIIEDVRSCIANEPEVHASFIKLDLLDGLLIVEGEVSSLRERKIIINAINRINGFNAILNKIKINKEISYDDDEILRCANNILKNDFTLANEQIELKVNNGNLTLIGNVNSYFQRLNAEYDLSKQAGIKSINNLIHLKPNGELPGLFSLHKQISQQTSCENLKIDINGRELVLSGVTNSQIKRFEVEEAAWLITGVTFVKNEIKICL